MTEFRRLAIPEVMEITPARHGDDRGYFSEVYKRDAFEAQGLHIDWLQDNQSLSAARGTVRGLHFQAPPFAQHKLVRVLRGAIFDVALDIRAGSPSCGRWVGVELSAERGNQLFVPVGFAHGFMTLEPDTIVHYKVSATYCREAEGAVRWDDPALAIAWPRFEGAPALSAKDETALPLASLATPFVYEA